MNRAIRFAFAVVLGLSAVAAVLFFLGRGGGSPSGVPETDLAADSSEVQVAAPGPETRDEPAASELLPDAPDRAEQAYEAQILKGRVLERGTGAPVESGEVLLLASPDHFVDVPLFADESWQGAAPADPEPVARAPLRAGGAFELVGPTLSGYLTVRHPALAVREVVQVRAASDRPPVTLWVEPAGGVGGTVVNASGAPREQVRVTLRQPENPMEMVRLGSHLRVAAATTDQQGRFRFWSVPAGVPMLLKAEPDDAPPVSRTVTVAPGETPQIRLEIVPGYAISGRVISSQGRPIEVAQVFASQAVFSISAAQSGNVDDHRSRDVTDEQGRFELGGLGASTYTVRAEAEGFAPGVREDVELSSGGIELASDIVLVEGLSIRGVVVDDLGDPVPEATLGFLKSNSFMGIGLGELMPPGKVRELGGSTGTSDDTGHFQSPPLHPGSYDVSGQAEGLSIGSVRSVQAGSSGTELVLKRSGSIEGIVLSRAAGEPVTDYTLAAARPFAMLDLKSYVPGPVQQVSKEDGTFRIEGLEGGAWNLQIAAAEFARAEVTEIEVQPGRATRGVIVLLDEAGVIRGLVLDRSTGRALGGAQVTTRSGTELLRTGSLDALANARADEAGRFELGGLTTGQYTVSASADDHARGASKRIYVTQGQVTDGVTIELDPGAVIRGRVIAADQTPETGALVQAVALGSMQPAMDTTDGDGRYELRGLSAGQYTVTKLGGSLKVGSSDMIASLMEGLSTQTVKVGAGEVVELDFIAGAGGSVTLHGRVSEGGDPLENAILSLMPVGGGGSTAGQRLRLSSTGEHGEYRIEGVAPGEWTMTIQTGSPFGQSAKESFDLTIPKLPDYRRDFDLALTGFRGRVTSSALDQPLSGVRVAVTAADDSVAVDAFSRAAGSRRVADVFTGPDGFYQVSGLEVGEYRAAAGGPGMFGLGGSGYCRSEPVTVVVGEGELKDDVNFRLRPGGSLRGQVTDTRGMLVPAATVFLVGSNAEIEEHFGEIVADETGKYRATGIEPGGYTVVVKASGYAPSVNPGVSVRESAETERDVVLRSGGTLAVAVHGVEAEMLAGARVRLFDGAGTELTAFVTLGEAMGSVLGAGAGAGRYELGELEPGVYTAEVVMGGVVKVVKVEHGSGDQVVEVVWP